MCSFLASPSPFWALPPFVHETSGPSPRCCLRVLMFQPAAPRRITLLFLPSHHRKCCHRHCTLKTLPSLSRRRSSGRSTVGSRTPRVHHRAHSPCYRPQRGGCKRRTRSSLRVLPAGGAQGEFQRRRRENGSRSGGAGKGGGRCRGGVLFGSVRSCRVEVGRLVWHRVVLLCYLNGEDVGFVWGGRDLSDVGYVSTPSVFFLSWVDRVT